MRIRGRIVAAGVAVAVGIAVAPAASAGPGFTLCGEATDATIVLDWNRSTTDVTLSPAERTAECGRLMKTATELRPVSEVRVSSISSSSNPTSAPAAEMFADGKWTPE